jgi:fatty-acyl-CoA synthase
VIVSHAGTVMTLAALNVPIAAAAADGIVSTYARLDRLEVIDAMTRTSVGKIDKKALRARFG